MQTFSVSHHVLKLRNFRSQHKDLVIVNNSVIKEFIRMRLSIRCLSNMLKNILILYKKNNINLRDLSCALLNIFHIHDSSSMGIKASAESKPSIPSL